MNQHIDLNLNDLFVDEEEIISIRKVKFDELKSKEEDSKKKQKEKKIKSRKSLRLKEKQRNMEVRR